MLDRLQLGLLRRDRLPLILQAEAAECGLACLAMVASAHGLHTDLSALRGRFSVSLQGCTMADLLRMAQALGLQGRGVRAELDQLRQLQRPCILHWDLNHFVVLARVSRGHAVIHDPARGVRRVSFDELSRHFSGVALELSPGTDFRPREERRRVRLRELIGPVRGGRRALVQLCVLALVLEVFVLLGPFFLQAVVDGVLVSADRDLLVTLGLAFGALVLLEAGTAALRSWSVLYLSATLNLQWLGQVFAHLLRLPLAWFEKRHAGDVMSRFQAVRHIQETLTTHFVEALIDGVLVVATFAMMLAYSPRLAAIAAAGVTAYGLLRGLYFRAQRRAGEAYIAYEAQAASHFLESLRGIQAIRLHGGETDREGRYLNRVVDTMNADIARRRLDLGFATGRRLLLGLERVAVVWAGALLVLDQSLSVGMLFAFLAYKEQFATRLGAWIDKSVELRMLQLHAERLADIVLTPTEPSGPPVTAARAVDGVAAEAAPRIEFRAVSFRYADGEPLVLDGCSLTIEPGESVAIVGPSGCGKTTLLKLLLGIHVPTGGAVLVDGQPLAQYGLARWRQRLGTVMQDDTLFAGSIAENIAFFAWPAPRERVEHCARLASLHEDILAMPMGYETLIGDLGTALSGGQKQRLLLARALYREPQVLLLDEATSALDVDRERVVTHAVRQLGMTRVIVAHRPETIAAASRVIVLQQGRVATGLRSVNAGPDSAASSQLG